MTQRMNDNLLKAMLLTIVFITLMVRSWLVDDSAQGRRQTNRFNAASAGQVDTLKIIHTNLEEAEVLRQGIRRVTR